jgi:hypothetical protein
MKRFSFNALRYLLTTCQINQQDQTGGLGYGNKEVNLQTLYRQDRSSKQWKNSISAVYWGFTDSDQEP